MGVFLKQSLTSATEPKTLSPKIVFLGTDFSSDEIKSTYSVLNYLQNLAPYDACVSLTIKKVKETLSGVIEMTSHHFSTKLAIEEIELSNLLVSLREKTKEQLLDWKRTRF